MGASLISGRSSDGELREALVDRLGRIAGLAAALPEERAAAALTRYAERLREPGSQIMQVHKDVALLLRAGPGSLSDQYFVRDDGTPDIELSEHFVALIEDARRLNSALEARF